VTAKKLTLSDLDHVMQSGGLHPVVKAAVFLVQDENGEFYRDEIPVQNIAFLKQVLDAAEVDGHIKEAVLDLGKLSAVLHRQAGGKRVALHLYALCEQTIVEKQLLNLEADFEAIEDTKPAIGRTEKVIPAKVGEKPPEGSLKIDKLAPKRRI
jgi:hypothetical protein